MTSSTKAVPVSVTHDQQLSPASLQNVIAAVESLPWRGLRLNFDALDAEHFTWAATDSDLRAQLARTWLSDYRRALTLTTAGSSLSNSHRVLDTRAILTSLEEVLDGQDMIVLPIIGDDEAPSVLVGPLMWVEVPYQTWVVSQSP